MNNFKISEIQKLSQIYKNKTFQNSMINSALLILIFLFFSIGFDLTYKIYTNLINLNWGHLLATSIDFIVLYYSIRVIYSFKQTINNPDYLFDTKHIYKDEDLNNHTIEFLKNARLYKKLDSNISFLTFLIFINLIGNVLVNAYFNQLSLWNELYITSGLFNQLPIFPIIQILLFVLLVFMYPVILSYGKYKENIAKIINHEGIINHWHSDRVFIQLQQYVVFTVLIFYCLLMSSVFKKENKWLFQYYNPHTISTIEDLTPLIKEQEICKYEKVQSRYNQNILTYHIEYVYSYKQTKTYIKEIDFFITPTLKKDIEQFCNNNKDKN